MDVVEMTRQLGAAIQLDERYVAFINAKKKNEDDMALNALIGKLNLVQMNYQNESGKETPDEKKLEGFDDEFRKLYAEIMVNDNMKAYEAARGELDSLMNYIVNLLSLCANGEDPATCEVKTDDENCAGDCSSCGGCS